MLLDRDVQEPGSIMLKTAINDRIILALCISLRIEAIEAIIEFYAEIINCQFRLQSCSILLTLLVDKKITKNVHIHFDFSRYLVLHVLDVDWKSIRHRAI